MPKLNEVKKFKILTDIANHKALYAEMNITEIQDHICKQFDSTITTNNLAKWSKIYGFTYKFKKLKKLDQAEIIKRTNQRIRTLSMVVRNLCKQLEINHPTMLDKLIDGITDQYGAASCFDTETQELEDKIHDSI